MNRRCPTRWDSILAPDFHRAWLPAAFALLVVAAAPAAYASTATDGVSEERLSLPEGPGSLEGIGENVSLDRNMGQMSYSVPIAVPAGFPGVTPSLALSYSSGAGNSSAGVGWALEVPFIERLTVRGLPKYTTDDGFAVGGSEELVRIPATDPAVYRARFEGGFVRYTWKDAGTGADGYWTAEYPDGRIGYFGADATGATVAKARVAGPKGTFRYLLVSMVDRYAHRVDWAYDLFGNKSLPVHVGWVFVGDKPEYEATFAYEDRTDRLSDCRAGFEELLDKRLSQVNVLAHGTRIRRYALSYDDPALSGGLSRLAGVQMYGKDDGAYPIHESFEYQRALGVDCTSGQQCEKPYVVSMGSLGIDMQKGTSTLIDLNGDGLPDLVDASEAGKPHRIFHNVLKADGTHSFVGPVDSALGNQGGFDLGSPYVQVLDVDGDGFADLLNAQTGQVLFNRGTGDWAKLGTMWTGSTGGGLPDLNTDFDPSQGSLRTVRFVDYDNDKRIDVIRSEGTGAANQTFIYRNTGNGAFQLDAGADSIGAGFESDRLELNDMNGDGLEDVVLVNTDEVRYRLNLGWGHWGDWVVIPLNTQFTNQEAIDAELDDLNGDALADLVLVQGTTVRYWLNRNGASFDAERDVTAADVNGEIPERLSTTTVFQADMDGNGSNDIVWIDGSGKVTYLELFPTRPNLLSKITNGIGRVTQVTYASSVQSRAADEATAPWTHALPFPMTVVKSTDEWDELTKVHTVTTFTYHDGYFDGAEKRFRGYVKAESSLAGDDLQEAGTTLEQYDVGVDDAYRAGLLLVEEQVSGGRSIQVTTHTYDDCPVAGLPDGGLLFPVRHVCETAETVEHREGATDSKQWVTTGTAWGYDGYGNVTLLSDLGVTAVGGSACDACAATGFTGTPCGAKCLGDERYTATTYVTPEGNADRWILGLPAVVRVFGVAKDDGTAATDLYSETTSFYDGDAFTGLPAGKADHGTLTRVTERVDTTGATRDKARNRLDGDGNVVETLDPLGAAGSDGHRRMYTMSADGLRVVRVELFLKDAAGPYRLRQEVQHDPVWDLPVENTAWMVVTGDQVQDAHNSMNYAYDEFGRISAIVAPGDSLEAPSATYEYDMKSPSSRILLHRRSQAGQPADLEEVRCLDGRGRMYQQRDLASQGTWRVTGFSIFNLQGIARSLYDPYTSATDQCDAAPPDGTLHRDDRYDAVGRLLERTWPQVAGESVPAVERTSYAPLTMTHWDLDDTVPGGAFEDTPTVTYRNGLGMTVRMNRSLQKGGQPVTHSMAYGELGDLTASVDPIGALHLEGHDLLGRVVKVTDPDRGTSTFEYDAAGNRTRSTDARGGSIRTAFDGANRMVEQWSEADEAGTRVDETYDRPADCPAEKCTNVASRVASARYPLGGGKVATDRYGYSARGLPVWSERDLAGRSFQFATAYDDADRVVGNTFPGGRSIAVTLDGTGEVVAVPGFVDHVTWDARSLPAAYDLHNGVSVKMTRDERKRLAALQAIAKDGASRLLDLAYTRDSEGNVLSVADGRADDGKPTGDATYSYDALYRLVGADLDRAHADREDKLTIAYDGADRILSTTSNLAAGSPAHVGDYAYGQAPGSHAVVQAGSVAFAYDASGNMTTRGDASYSWDHLGRIVVASRGGQVVARSVYGPGADRMIESEGGHVTYYLSSDFEVRDGVAVTWIDAPEEHAVRIEDPAFVTHVLSDVAPAQGGDQALAAQPDGWITAGDAWVSTAVAAGILAFAGGTVPDDAAAMLAASAQRMLVGESPVVRYLHHDHAGNTVAMTADDGALTGRTAYYPFGQVRFDSQDGEVHLFSGKEQDAATGLVDFGARRLDPWTGRWTSPDPAFRALEDLDPSIAPEATAGYGFVGGDPVNASDPDGRQKVADCTKLWGRIKATVMLKLGVKLRLSMGEMYARRMLPGERPSWKVAWQVAKKAGGVSAWDQNDRLSSRDPKSLVSKSRSPEKLAREFDEASTHHGGTHAGMEDDRIELEDEVHTDLHTGQQEVEHHTAPEGRFLPDLAIISGKLGHLTQDDAKQLWRARGQSEFLKSGRTSMTEFRAMIENTGARTVILRRPDQGRKGSTGPSRHGPSESQVHGEK